MDIIYRILIGIVAIFVIVKYLQPLLLPLIPPLGLIIVIALFLGVLAYLLGRF